MKTLQIENAKTRFFATKEDYLKFRQAWKDFHNNGNAKAFYVDIDVSPWNHPSGLDRIMMRQKQTPLSAEHYALYNLLRGYPAHRGFTPANNEDPYHGLRQCLIYLMWLTNYFQEKFMDRDRLNSMAQHRDKLSQPFGELPNEVYVEISKILDEYLKVEQDWTNVEVNNVIHD